MADIHHYQKEAVMFIFLDIEPNDNEDSKMLEIPLCQDRCRL